tara:strand:+ start:1442 stop:2092 length:651 start_codon:yes stop_codon:yes gene_type:complete
MDQYQILELIDAYNQNPDRYTDQEAETIAQLAQIMDTRFARESQPFKKGLFDLVDTAAFGLLPNEWRPVSRGDSVFGDSGEEEIASIAGMIGGGVAGGVGLAKGARGLMKRFSKKGTKASGSPTNLLRLTEGQGAPLRLGEGQRLLSGQTGRQVRQNRFPLDQASGQPMPMTSGAGQAIPMRGNIGEPMRYLKPSSLLENTDEYLDTMLNNVLLRY